MLLGGRLRRPALPYFFFAEDFFLALAFFLAGFFAFFAMVFAISTPPYSEGTETRFTTPPVTMPECA
jgi:hypothetical protein